jgi:hypothetical protein
MPRCCAVINDPSNTSNVLVHCEVHAPDEATGLAAARDAAHAAYGAVHPGQEPPTANVFTLPGRLTHTTVELGS